MATTIFASRKHSEQPSCWLLGLARAGAGWTFICLTVLLPLSRLADAGAEAHVLLAAIITLLIGAGCGLILWAADAVRERG
jgi:hypothetical protein